MTASNRSWRYLLMPLALAGMLSVSSAAELNPAAVTYKLPDQIPWSPVDARGAQNAVSLAYNCYWGDNPADRDTQDGTATVEVNGVAAPALTRQLKASGTATANVYTFELGELLTAETNEVKLRVTNAHGVAA